MYFIDDIRKQVGCGILVEADVFMDLSRAFETIRHIVLAEKLKTYGISEKEILWFNDYL